MSVEIRSKIICDNCGASIVSRVQTKTTGLTSYWEVKDEAEHRKWMFNLRYGTTRHVCDTCADGKPKVTPPPVFQTRTPEQIKADWIRQHEAKRAKKKG